MSTHALLNVALGLLLAPLLLGVINRTKAAFAGRRGPPLLQLYFDLVKLLGKGAVYSTTTSFVFRAGPVVGLACAVVALTLVPLGPVGAAVAFSGDLVLLAYVLGLWRFVTVLAALDTGSAFEGMGASREVQFSALAEPALLLGLAALARRTDATSLTAVAEGARALGAAAAPELALVGVALFVVLLCECSRIPFDDPNTHLELTMVHEVMVLDHGGPDFAFILYAASLKLWVLGSLLVSLVVPAPAALPWQQSALAVALLLAVAVGVGVVESSIARVRLVRVPTLLAGATVLSATALVLVATRAHDDWLSLALVLVAAANFLMLTMSRLGSCIRVVALQGVLVAAVAVLAHPGALGPRTWAIVVATVALKGILFPLLLLRTLQLARIRREIEPFVGFVASFACGLALLGLAAWLGARLPLRDLTHSALVVPVALFCMLTGLFVSFTRRKALTQVLGYLVFENGVACFGLAAVAEVPALVELGVLLDVFVAVFVMGIAVFQINREFDHVDADKLTTLQG